MSGERVKWYDPTTLEVMDQVPSADGKKQVSATIMHARKLGLLPSVTQVIKLLANFQIEKYRMDQAIRACIEWPFDQPRTEEGVEAYCKTIAGKAAEPAKAAADRGTDIHGDMGRWVDSGLKAWPDDPVSRKICEKLDDFTAGFAAEHSGLTIISEKRFGGKTWGYTGQPDFVLATAAEVIAILDLKTTKVKSDKPEVFDSWKLQLGGYRPMTKDQGIRLFSCIGDRDDGDAWLIELDDPDRWERAFQTTFDLWCLLNNYDPRA